MALEEQTQVQARRLMNLEDHCSRKLYQGFYAHWRLGKEESSRHSSTATFGNASTDLDLDEPMVYDA